jgi:erythromycin esterase-like protein
MRSVNFAVVLSLFAGCRAHQIESDVGLKAVQANQTLPSSQFLDSSGELSDGAKSSIAATISGAKYVGIGEDVHLSQGLMDLNFKVAKSLIANNGFRSIVFESDYFATALINDVIQGKSVSLFEALKMLGLYRSTNKAVVDFVIWCRSYNAAHPNAKIQFLGYDHQDAYAAGNVLRTFLRNNLSDADFSAVWADFSVVPGATELTYANYLQKQKSTTYTAANFLDHLNRIAALGRFLNARRASWVQAGVAAGQYQVALWALQSMQFETKKNLAYAKGEKMAAMEDREAATAFIFLNRIVPEASTGKAIIFAHNFHVGRLPNNYVLNRNSTPIPMPTSFGQRISEVLGHDYRVFLTMVHSVSGPRYQAYVTPPGSVQDVLNRQVNKAAFFPVNNRLDFWTTEKLFFAPDSSVPATYRTIPSQYADGIFWLPASTAAEDQPANMLPNF